MKSNQIFLFLGVIVVAVVAGVLAQSGSSGRNRSSGPFRSDPPLSRGTAEAKIPNFIHERIGTWRGTSWQNEMGIFLATPPRSTDPEKQRSRDATVEADATIHVELEVNEKYLQIPGTESCWITLEYESRDGDRGKSRDMFQILPQNRNDGPDHRGAETSGFVLRGTTGELEIMSQDENQISLQGRINFIGSGFVGRVIRVTLAQDKDDSVAEAGPDDDVGD